MAIYDGSLLRLKIDGSTVYHSTEASISMSRDFKERATKDTEGTELSPGIKSWSASCSALGVQELPSGVTGALAFEALFDKYDADTALDVEFSLDATGTTFYKGKCYIESLELNAPNEEDATASISLRGSGVVEKDTVA